MNQPASDTASVGKRIGGGLIDLVISFVLILLIGAFAGLGTAEVGDDRIGASVNVDGAPFLYAAGIVFVLFALMEWRLGKTPGKFITGTRVITTEGARPGFVAALVRNLLRYIDGIAFYLVGLLVVAATRDLQRLGDLAARTLVVDD